MKNIEEDIAKMFGLQGRAIVRFMLLLESGHPPIIEIVELIDKLSEPVTTKYNLTPVE
jgi:hypothetical protein